MLGTKFEKPLPDEKLSAYAEAAAWCNANGATIEDKGDYYEVVALPEPTVDEVREQKLSQLNSIFDAWRSDGATLISSLGFEADADEKAYTDVNGLVTLGQSATFMDAHNEPHVLTIEQLTTLQRELIQSGNCAYQTKWSYRNSINSATTVAELDAIEIKFEPKDFSA